MNSSTPRRNEPKLKEKYYRKVRATLLQSQNLFTDRVPESYCKQLRSSPGASNTATLPPPRTVAPPHLQAPTPQSWSHRVTSSLAQVSHVPIKESDDVSLQHHHHYNSNRPKNGLSEIRDTVPKMPRFHRFFLPLAFSHNQNTIKPQNTTK